MKRKGPIITLAAGLLLAAVLLLVDLSVTKKRDAANTAADKPVAAVVKNTPAPTTPAPTPTATQPAAVGTQTTYAGKAGAGTIAIAVKDGKAVAYLCDGHTTEAWLQGTVQNGAINLTGSKNASLTGSLANGAASGSVTAAGRQWTFTAKVVAPPSGLYRAAANVRGAQIVGGWIVLENGQQIGMVDYGDHEEAAPPLTGTSANIGGTPVTAVQLDGTGL
jgi:hypothetical protein